MSNLLGANFEPYVAEQISVRQARLGKDQLDNETISWANSRTAYVALASSVDIENTPIYETTVQLAVNISTGEPVGPIGGDATSRPGTTDVPTELEVAANTPLPAQVDVEPEPVEPPFNILFIQSLVTEIPSSLPKFSAHGTDGFVASKTRIDEIADEENVAIPNTMKNVIVNKGLSERATRLYFQSEKFLFNNRSSSYDSFVSLFESLSAYELAVLFLLAFMGQRPISGSGTNRRLLYVLLKSLKVTGRFDQVAAVYNRSNFITEKDIIFYQGGDPEKSIADQPSLQKIVIEAFYKVFRKSLLDKFAEYEDSKTGAIQYKYDDQGYLDIVIESEFINQYRNSGVIGGDDDGYISLFPSQLVGAGESFKVTIDNNEYETTNPYGRPSFLFITGKTGQPEALVEGVGYRPATTILSSNNPPFNATDILANPYAYSEEMVEAARSGQTVQIELQSTDTQIGTSENGTQRLKDLGLTESYLGSELAKNLVLTNGVTKVNDDGSRTYKAGVADNISMINDYVYGFGGDSDWGLVAMPGLLDVDIKSKNMGSLREATVKIRANSEKQFGLIDALYCRIGYTMFLEWGNSIYINNSDKYVSNPITGGVQSLIPSFLTPTTDDCFSGDINAGLQKKIETNREISCGNYDAFLGRVANFSWDFNSEGYYEITLKLVSIGDIIESLKIDQTVGNINLNNSVSAMVGQPSGNSALESFLTIAAQPNGNITFDINEAQDEYSSDDVETDITFNFDIVKNTLVASTSYSEVPENNYNSTVAFEKRSTPGGEYSAQLNYSRPESAQGKVISARAQFDEEIYYYIRLGDILDFIKAKLLIYNPECDNKPIFDIDTNEDTNVCYAHQYNMSADPSKVMVRSNLPPKDILKGWAQSFDNNGKQNWEGTIRRGDILSSDFGVGTTSKGFEFREISTKIEYFKTTSATINGKEIGYHGKIMNIYFEYKFLLDTIQKNRDKTSGDLKLYKFIEALCKTANECLGGINKLTPRIQDDNKLQIIDQNPLYGTQEEPPKMSIFNLYGINDKNGSFVREFNIKTQLTNEFASQVTIGAQAQGSKDTTDALALSNWNYGLIDRMIPKKLSSSDITKSKVTSTYENILNVRNQLMVMWCAYAEGDRFWLTNKLEFDDDEATSFLQYAQASTGERLSQKGLDEAKTIEDLKNGWKRENMILLFENFPTKRYSQFVKLQKDLFALLHINSDTPSNQQGMIPLNISVEMDGLSGIKIYNQLPVDIRFIPNYYPQTLFWIIKGVSHKIKDNKWTTELETIAVPKIPAIEGASSTASTKITNAQYEYIPFDDITAAGAETDEIYEEGLIREAGGGGGTGQITGGDASGLYQSPHLNPQTQHEKEQKAVFLQKFRNFTQPEYVSWAPIIDSNTTAYQPIKLTSVPQANRGVNSGNNHYGVDFGVPVGYKLLAPEDGIFEIHRGEDDPSDSFGVWASVKVQKGSDTWYHNFAHLSKTLVSSGTRVKKGDVIALSGGAKGDPTSGTSTGPHLHYEIRINSIGKDSIRESVVDWINRTPPPPGAQLLYYSDPSGTLTKEELQAAQEAAAAEAANREAATNVPSKNAFVQFVQILEKMFLLKDTTLTDDGRPFFKTDDNYGSYQGVEYIGNYAALHFGQLLGLTTYSDGDVRITGNSIFSILAKQMSDEDLTYIGKLRDLIYEKIDALDENYRLGDQLPDNVTIDIRYPLDDELIATINLNYTPQSLKRRGIN